MRKFLFFLFKVILVFIVMAVVLDFLYTSIYLDCNNRRKVGFAYTSKPKKIDVVILGSSRADNHFVSQMFKEKGFYTFNFGMQGSRLFESDLILKILLDKKNIIKNVIVEVDLNLRSDLNEYSESNVLKFMPYLHDSKIIRDHVKDLEGGSFLYYIPFYRYIKYETKLGFREVFFSAANKKSKELDYGGYNALQVSDVKLESNISNFLPGRNKYYEDIKQLCKKNNINLIAVMTPMCQNTKGTEYFEKVKNIYPEIHNYSNVVKEDKYFSSCGHMNDAGAKIFTARILKDFFKK